MLDYYRVSLLSTLCFMNHCVKGSLNGENCHSDIVAMVYTDPPEADTFYSFLEL